MASSTGLSFPEWKKTHAAGTFEQWKNAPAPSTPKTTKTPVPATPAKKPNFTVSLMEAQKKNPNLTSQEFEKTFNAQAPGNAAYLDQAKTKNQALAKSNQQKAQENYVNQGGKLAPGQVYDPYAMLQKGAQTGQAPSMVTQNEADQIRSDIGGVADYKTPIDKQTHYGEAKNTYEPLSFEEQVQQNTNNYEQQQEQAKSL